MTMTMAMAMTMTMTMRHLKTMVYNAQNYWVHGLAPPSRNLHGLSPRANYTDRATTACRRSDCQLLQVEGATWSA
jgi:hypothetical protein